MVKKIFNFLLIILIIFYFVSFILQNKTNYQKKFDLNQLKDLYRHSQFAQNPEQRRLIINDQDLYAYAGWHYLTTGEIDKVNIEHPPLGKYFIGFSVLLFGNQNIGQIFWGICFLTAFFFLAKKVLKNNTIALIITFLLSAEQLFRNQLKYSLLDLILTVFLLFLFLSILSSKKTNLIWLLRGILLGMIASIKYPTIAIVAAAVVATYYWIKKESKLLKKLFLIFIPSILIFLLSYLPFFLKFPNLLSFYNLQLTALRFHLSHVPEYPKAQVFNVLFFNRWLSWWGEKGYVKTDFWNFLWPILTFNFLVCLFKFKKNLLINLWALFYLIFLSLKLFFPRYLLFLLPFFYIQLGFNLKRLSKRFCFLFFFFFLIFFTSFSHPKKAEAIDSNNYLTFVFLVRDKKQWLNQAENWLEKQTQLINENQYPATWLLNFDTLKDEETVTKMKSLSQNQELGILLEIAPNLALKLNLPYDRLAASHEPQNLFLSGYSLKQRQKIIDYLFQIFKENFGYYPKSVGAWFIDSWSLNYLQQKYQIKTALLVAEQYKTDHHTVRGHIWQAPFYPSKKHALKPATNLEEKINLVAIQWAAREPLRGYGYYTEHSNFSVQANDYSQKGLDENYFEKLLKTYLENPFNDFNQLTVGIEVGQEGAKYFAEFEKLISVVKRNKNKFTITGMADFSDIFQEKYPSLIENNLITWQDKDENSWAGWFSNNNYRLGIIANEEGVFIRDLRTYNSNQDDLYFSADKRRELFRQTEAIVDEVGLGKKWLLINKSKPIRPEVIKNNKNFVLSFGDKQIILNEANFEFNFTPIENNPQPSNLKEKQENNLWQFTPIGTEVSLTKSNKWLFFSLIIIIFLWLKFPLLQETILSFLIAFFSLSLLLFEIWVLTPFNDLGFAYLGKIKSFSLFTTTVLIYILTPLLLGFLGMLVFSRVKKYSKSLFLGLLAEIMFFFPNNLGWFFPLYRKLPLDPGMVTGLKNNLINFVWFFKFPSLDKLSYAFSKGQMHIDFFSNIITAKDYRLLLLPIPLLFFLLINFGFSFGGIIYFLVEFLRKKKSKLILLIFLSILSPLGVNILDPRLPNIGEILFQALGTIGIFVFLDQITKKARWQKVLLAGLILVTSLPAFTSLIKRNQQLAIRLNSTWADRGKIRTVLNEEKRITDCFLWQLNPKENNIIYIPLGIDQYFFFDLNKLKNNLEVIVENSYAILGRNLP